MDGGVLEVVDDGKAINTANANPAVNRDYTCIYYNLYCSYARDYIIMISS